MQETIHTALVDVNDSCLVIIDVQGAFLDKLPTEEVAPLVQRMLWLVRVAIQLEVPVVVTAEDINQNGSIIPALAKILQPDTRIYNLSLIHI